MKERNWERERETMRETERLKVDIYFRWKILSIIFNRLGILPCNCKIKITRQCFFMNWPNPVSFFVYFRRFKHSLQILEQIGM